MIDPILYVKLSEIVCDLANENLDEWIPKFKHKHNSNLLDIGCGDGSVLYTSLLEKFPFKYQNAIGIDISQKMVEYCKNHPAKKPNTDIMEMDISCPDVPRKFNEYFDYIFSFSALHWVQNQRKTFSNIYEMLKPGGEIFLLIHISNFMFDSWDILKAQNPWNNYLDDLKDFFPCYYRCENPEEEIINLLKETGFINYSVKYKKKIWILERREDLKNYLRALTVFINRIPEELQEKFLDCMMDTVISFSGKAEQLTYHFKYIIVYAQKKNQ